MTCAPPAGNGARCGRAHARRSSLLSALEHPTGPLSAVVGCVEAVPCRAGANRRRGAARWRVHVRGVSAPVEYLEPFLHAIGSEVTVLSRRIRAALPMARSMLAASRDARILELVEGLEIGPWSAGTELTANATAPSASGAPTLRVSPDRPHACGAPSLEAPDGAARARRRQDRCRVLRTAHHTERGARDLNSASSQAPRRTPAGSSTSSSPRSWSAHGTLGRRPPPSVDEVA